jgi:hypothetical protein
VGVRVRQVCGMDNDFGVLTWLAFRVEEPVLCMAYLLR